MKFFMYVFYFYHSVDDEFFNCMCIRYINFYLAAKEI